MKRVFFVLLIITVSVACKQPAKGTNGVAYKSPVQYNDYIINRQTSIMKNILAFGEIAHAYPDSARIMLKKYSQETTGYINEIKGMPPYEGDSSLRNAAINTFSFYKSVFDNEYREILILNENMTEENSLKANQLIENITKQEDRLDKAFHNAQKEFARKNNMELIENEIQKKVKELDKN